MKILLTGATGFLGSHIAEALISGEHEIIAIKRETSKCDCLSFSQSITWVRNDQDGWQNLILSLSPEIIIHSAWTGVNSNNRNSWDCQMSNIRLMVQLLEIGRQSKIRKFISLGSQAEYGQFSGKINELYPVNPTSMYGIVKLLALEILKSYSEIYHIDWYWLRIFSVFGERESESWLIPSVITRILRNEKGMDFTQGDQKYAYLYARDFALAIKKVVESAKSCPGIYNISSSNPIKLKELLKVIIEKMNPIFELNFGAIPYRPSQSMHMEGDILKFRKAFGNINVSDFGSSLDKTIKYYKEKIQNETI
jgi:UDP-glucose 4-epimerase